jgi:hypothetical protein
MHKQLNEVHMPFPVDIKYIEETERELGVQFPEKFKAKMTKDNGGELAVFTDDSEDECELWLMFPFCDKSDKKRLSRTCNHIALETKNSRRWINFPTKGIAIAHDEGGNYLILLPEEATPHRLKENIFMWLHETGEITEIANSIEELGQ